MWSGWILAIDVCPSNGNLVATAGSDHRVKIYDRRESKMIKTLNTLHSGS